MNKLIMFSGAIALSSFVLSSNAAIVQLDYASYGDSLLTYDVDNSREWLDVSTTVGISINDALATYGADGFRLATAAELTQLYVGAGVSEVWDVFNNIAVAGTSNTFYNVDNAAGYDNLVTLYNALGGGTSNFGGNFWIHGYLADEDNDGLSFLGRMEVDSNPGAAHVNSNDEGWEAHTTHSQIGSFLVRDVTVVPVPAAAWLFGSGLIGLVGVARRKAA